MGYATPEITGFGGAGTLIAPQFIGVGEGNTIDLQSIKCPEGARDKVYLQTFTAGGGTKKQYNWVRKRIEGVFHYGWVDFDDQDVFAEGVTFNPGEGFWLLNDGEEGANTFQTSGQVMQKDLAYLLGTDGAGVICANTTPVAVDLQDILCPESARDKVYLQTFTAGGGTKKQYNWVRKRIEGVFHYGWVDFDDQDVFAEGVTFQPGEAFWVLNDGDEAAANTLTIPGVEIK